MKCTYCGYENGLMGGFCRNCGKKLPESAPNGQMNSNQTVNSANPNMHMGGYGQPNSNQTVNSTHPIYSNGQMNGYGQPSTQNQIWGKMREKEFYQRFASKSTKSLIIIVAVLSFLSAAVSGIELLSKAEQIRFAMMFSNEVTFYVVIAVIETIYFFIMGILILILQKWFLPLIVIIEGIMSTIFVTVITENFSGRGIAFIAFAIACMIQLKKVNAAYKVYKNTGNIPERLI